VGRLLEQSREEGKNILAGAYLDVVLGANSEAAGRIVDELVPKPGWF
jgi:hypothetical protein